jgi:serine/threonine-protein kinase RsbW
VQFNLRTVVAEALANAITYGNREDPTKQVVVRVDARPEAIRVTVIDAGDGFDPSGVPDPTTPDALEREVGRGLFVIRHLVDAVDFNAKGNAVCLTLRAG